MGFLDGLAKAGKAAYDVTASKMERVQEYKYEYASLSDEQLMRKYKSSTGERKYACAMLLKERGYGN